MKTYMDSIDSGSQYQFGDKLLQAENPKSAFDLSHLNSLTINNCGSLIPIALWETVPSDTFEISVTSLVRVLPQVVPLYSRQRLYVYAFYSRACDLWKNAHAYYKKGYDGNYVINKPVLTENNMSPGLWDSKITADSLGDYLGLPQGFTYKELSETAPINALPFFMYEKIFQAFFIEKNLPYYRDNRAWLPHDEADLRFGATDNEIISNSYLAEGQTGITLGSLEYRNYPLDYFTSALPSPTRGTAPTLPFTASLSENPLVRFDTSPTPSSVYDFNSGPSASGGIRRAGVGYFYANFPIESNSNIPLGGNGSDIIIPAGSGSSIAYRHAYVDMSMSEFLSNITLDKFRELSITTEEVERMARTDGSYVDFGTTFFGIVCKNAFDFKPTLIGATYQSMNFSEVLQTTPTSTSPLGAYAGHGISVPTNNGYLGKIVCDDYGYIMIVATIMPDVYYHQGLSKLWTKSLQSEEFLPKRAKMGLIPVLNRELFVSGDVVTDRDLFAYQNPFDEMRYMPNEIHGKIADSENLSFFPYTQARHFTSTPTYSKEFFEARDVRKDYLAGGTAEDAYSAQFKFDIRAVRPLSYIPVPAVVV
ncbi:major capsid protein [Capybara microvirus Cap1_SP_95]|nr:major capsid protein [Capybara microvirus Cap1_SP_95]